MNLRTLDQRVELHQAEACALYGALQRYLHQVVLRSGQRPVPLTEALSIKPVSKVHQRLARLLTAWPVTKPGKVPRPRKLRLEYDEQLQLLALHRAGELAVGPPLSPVGLRDALGKVQQRALHLEPLFQV